MGEIFVIIEHRQGESREITSEMLLKARELGREYSHDVVAILLAGKNVGFVDDIANQADKVMIFGDDRLEYFNADVYTEIISDLIIKHNPLLTLIGHTSWGMDFAPALSVRTGYPLATDCLDILMEDDRPKVIRQMYSGKVFSRVSFKESKGYLVTVRAGAFALPENMDKLEGKKVQMEVPASLNNLRKQFIKYKETGTGDVDISQAEFLVSIGRGIGDEENVEIFSELAESMGGTLSCSRPVVDMNWLPKYHQVGTSGKSVKPKVYLAFGISGAFQHISGISGAGTVIAINKDKKAPIFRVADYGVIDDLFTIVEALKEKIK